MARVVNSQQSPNYQNAGDSENFENARKQFEKQKKNSRKKPTRKFSISAMNPAARVLLIVIAVIIAVLAGFIIHANWRNNGARFALKLSQQIGQQQSAAERSAHLKLEPASKFSCVNQIAMEQGGLLFESQKATTVSGVKIPQWVIFAKKGEGDVLSEVTLYHYKQLGEFGNGVKVKNHVGTEGITTTMTPEEVQKYIGFQPLRVNYTEKGMQEAYKYYFKDKNTGDSVAYILYVNYENDLAVSAAEEQNQFILPFLTLR